MQWRRRSRESLYGTRFGRFRLITSGIWDVGTWTYLLVLVVVVATRVLGGNAPAILQPLQAIFPVLFVPALFVLLIAVLTKRWAQSIASVLLAVVFWFGIAPAREKIPAPFWVAKAARFRLASANLLFDNKKPGVTFANVLAQNADVVVLTEFTPDDETRAQTDDVLAKYPFRVLVPRSGPLGGAVLSKYPFDDVQRIGRDELPSVRVTLPTGELVRVVAVHPGPPLSARESNSWDQDLKNYGRYASDIGVDEPLVMSGDFNGTRWQPPFGHLLAGPLLRDAHETVGKGLTMSWPVHSLVPPFARLDHALFNERLFPVSVTDLKDEASDHRPFVIEFAVQAEA